MSAKDTPPQSPQMEQCEDDNMDVPFEEQDIAEVVDDSHDQSPNVDDSHDPSPNVDDSHDQSPDMDECYELTPVMDESERELAYHEHFTDDEELRPERDDAKLVFAEHADGVLCCAFHPKSTTIVASGGVDDVAYVWDITDGHVIKKTTQHNDSVESIGFSFDGKYLAVGDMGGTITIWNTDGYKKFAQFDLYEDLVWSVWHPGLNILISGAKMGSLYSFRTSTGENKLLCPSIGPRCNCGKIFPDGVRLVVGFTEGYLRVFDAKHGIALSTTILNDGKCSIVSLDVHRDNNLVICGCDNGDVILVCSQGGKKYIVLNNNSVTHLSYYVETIGFCKDPTFNVAASASLDGKLVIWDIPKQMIRQTHVFLTGIVQLIWHPTLPLVYTTHPNALIHIYDSKSNTVLREFMGHTDCIYGISLSSDGASLVTASNDKTLRVYDVKDN